MPSGKYKRKPFSEEHIKNMCLAQKKRKKFSKETRQKMSRAHKGLPSPNGFLGKQHTEETKKKMSISAGKGETHHRWIKDRTKIKGHDERNNPEYKQWRKNVLKRDKFKCRIFNLDCEGNVIVHHILIWSKYPELRYNINNGIALCHAHHPRKRAEEKRLASYFIKLIANSKEIFWQKS